MYKNFIDTALKANQKLKSYIDNELKANDLEYSGKMGFGGDDSLNIDLYAEEVFINSFIDIADIYSEEIGLLKSKSKTKIKDAKIIIDPLDGSDNFLSGLAYYGTSLALQINGVTRASIVYNLVDNTYTAKDEKGQIYTNKRVVNKSKIGIFERAYKFPEICNKLSQMGFKYRSPGAVALSLCDAKNYNFVLFAGNMRSFDLEAALYINNDLNIYKTEHFLLVSKNIKIFNEIKEIIKE